MSTSQVDFTNVRTRIDHRNRNRMKITFKLGTEETTGFKQFMAATKPQEVAEEDFIKNIFYMGCETFQERLQQAVLDYTEKEKTAADLPVMGEVESIPDKGTIEEL